MSFASNIASLGDGIFSSAGPPPHLPAGGRALGTAAAAEGDRNHGILLPSPKYLSPSDFNFKKYQQAAFLKKLAGFSDYDDDGKIVNPKPSVIKDVGIFLEYMPISLVFPLAEYYYGSGVSLYWNVMDGICGFSLYGDGTVDCFLKIAGKTEISKTVSLSDRPLLSTIFERIACAFEI